MGIRKNFKINEVSIYPSAFCKEGNNIWYALGGISLLMRYDIITMNSEIVSFIPGENIFQTWNYEAIFKYREKLFMIPSAGKEIAVYNISEKQIKKIMLDNCKKEKNDRFPMFCENILVNQNILYCFPAGYEYIIAINMETNTINYLFNIHEALKNAGITYIDPYGIWAEPYENGFYAIFNDCSYIWKWSATDNSLTYTPFWPEMMNDEGLFYLPPYFVLYSTKQNRLFRYDLRKPQGGFTPFNIEGVKIARKRWNLRSIGKSLAVLDAEDDPEAIFFDAQGKLYRYESADRPAHIFGSFGFGNYRGRVGQSVEGENIFYDSSANGYLIINGIDKNSDTFLPNKQNISPDEMRKFLSNHCSSVELNERFNEIKFPKYGLKWLLDDVANNMVVDKTNHISTVGDKIYEYIKS